MIDSQVDGQMWVGGDAMLKGSVTIGVGMPDSSGYRDDLVVGGDLTLRGGVVPNGNIVVEGNLTVRSSVEESFEDLNGYAYETNFNFSSAEERYKYQAYSYCKYSPDATATAVNSDIYISPGTGLAMSDDFAVVELSCQKLNRARTLSFNSTLGGKTIVAQLRSSGSSCDLEFTHTYNPRNILFVTCDNIEEVTIQGIVRGSLLAPTSKILGDYAGLDGQLVAANVGAIVHGQFMRYIFGGCLPSYIYSNMPSGWVPDFLRPW